MQSPTTTMPSGTPRAIACTGQRRAGWTPRATMPSAGGSRPPARARRPSRTARSRHLARLTFEHAPAFWRGTSVREIASLLKTGRWGLRSDAKPEEAGQGVSITSSWGIALVYDAGRRDGAIFLEIDPQAVRAGAAARTRPPPAHDAKAPDTLDETYAGASVLTAYDAPSTGALGSHMHLTSNDESRIRGGTPVADVPIVAIHADDAAVERLRKMGVDIDRLAADLAPIKPLRRKNTFPINPLEASQSAAATSLIARMVAVMIRRDRRRSLSGRPRPLPAYADDIVRWRPDLDPQAVRRAVRRLRVRRLRGLVAASAAGSAFDESKHPRDEKGRWTDKAGGAITRAQLEFEKKSFVKYWGGSLPEGVEMPSDERFIEKIRDEREARIELDRKEKQESEARAWASVTDWDPSSSSTADLVDEDGKDWYAEAEEAMEIVAGGPHDPAELAMIYPDYKAEARMRARNTVRKPEPLSLRGRGRGWAYDGGAGKGTAGTVYARSSEFRRALHAELGLPDTGELIPALSSWLHRPDDAPAPVPGLEGRRRSLVFAAAARAAAKTGDVPSGNPDAPDQFVEGIADLERNARNAWRQAPSFWRGTSTRELDGLLEDPALGGSPDADRPRRGGKYDFVSISADQAEAAEFGGGVVLELDAERIREAEGRDSFRVRYDPLPATATGALDEQADTSEAGYTSALSHELETRLRRGAFGRNTIKRIYLTPRPRGHRRQPRPQDEKIQRRRRGRRRPRKLPRQGVLSAKPPGLRLGGRRLRGRLRRPPDSPSIAPHGAMSAPSPWIRKGSRSSTCAGGGPTSRMPRSPAPCAAACAGSWSGPDNGKRPSTQETTTAGSPRPRAAQRRPTSSESASQN